MKFPWLALVLGAGFGFIGLDFAGLSFTGLSFTAFNNAAQAVSQDNVIPDNVIPDNVIPELSIAQITSPSLAQLDPQPEWYNCLTREVWSPAKQSWCDKLRQLQNTVYAIPNYGTITLTDGRYENTEQRFIVSLVNQQGLISFGDTSGDGIEDAAVLLNVNSGGSGQFVYLTVVQQVGQTPQPLEAVLLGDRVQPKLLNIVDRAITLNLVTQGANDPLCCPTQEVTRTYTIQPALIQTGGEPATPMPLSSPLPNFSGSDSSSNSTGSTPSENSASASIAGTVSYRQRIALPPNARVEVRLQDVSRPDAPAQTLATQIIPLQGRQVPIPFELIYNPDQIDPNHTYAVQAQILVDDQLWFVTTSRYAVITQGNPTSVDVIVQQPQ